MGDLAKYIAEVIEFVVAGILVLFSLLLFGYVIVQPNLADLPDELPFLASLGPLLPVFGIALIYALGILAEGVSRAVFEHGLEELTLEKLTERRSQETEPAFQARLTAAEAAIAGGMAVGGGKKRPAHDLHQARVKYYENLREEWRMAVTARSVPLTTQVEGQLKRLRIERATALSGSICSVALLLDFALSMGDPGWGLRGILLSATLLVTGCAIKLSFVRLGRYLSAIIRCHGALPEVAVTTP